MPFEWSDDQTSSAPRRATLWPHRSLTRPGFVTFFGATALLLTIPLLAVLATPVFWALLPFMGLVYGLQWWAMRRNEQDGQLKEMIEVGPEKLALTRYIPRGPDLHFETNPYWVQVNIYHDEGPVEDYLTLKSEGKEVELGAFLTPDERRALYRDLLKEIARLK